MIEEKIQNEIYDVVDHSGNVLYTPGVKDYIENPGQVYLDCFINASVGTAGIFIAWGILYMLYKLIIKKGWWQP